MFKSIFLALQVELQVEFEALTSRQPSVYVGLQIEDLSVQAEVQCSDLIKTFFIGTQC